jgi:DHA1 family bicyclomycin/chloramphenicol resistance-like MFS transporter
MRGRADAAWRKERRRAYGAMPFPVWLPLLLGFLIAVGPMSTDMYLPAFPAIEASLGGRPGTAQVTLATWFAGLAVGQIMQGTLADRFGRRAPLIAGTAVYTLASAGCALAPDLPTLATMRFLAAFGGSAGMVIPRAIVRDLADGHQAARVMSRLMLVMGVAPILAPSLGGLVLGVADWHAIFWIAALYGAICCAAAWLVLPETLPPRARIRLGPLAMARRYAAVLRERSFITHALILGGTSFATFAYLGGSPDVFIAQFHLAPGQYGALFGACAAGFIAASQINPALLPRLGAGRLMRAGAGVAVAATAALLGLAFMGGGAWWVFGAFVWLNAASNGFTNPNATVGALSRHGAQAGSASALMGTMQYVLGAASGLLVGLLADGTARPMAALMLLGAAVAAMADRLRPRA